MTMKKLKEKIVVNYYLSPKVFVILSFTNLFKLKIISKITIITVKRTSKHYCEKKKNKLIRRNKTNFNRTIINDTQ